jgi:glycine cleavage system transcriptional repressor
MAEKNHLILTAIGPDQVGLVERISQFIAGRSCNIEDSKMAVFCGEFAVIVLISGEPDQLERVAGEYHALESETGLSVSAKIPATRKSATGFSRYRLTASCMDHPGVVYQLSGVLSSFGVNIESLETTTYAAADSGTPIFALDARISIPATANVDSLRERFLEIEKQENIDIDLSPA